MHIAIYSDPRSMTSTLSLEGSLKQIFGLRTEVTFLKKEQIGALYSQKYDMLIVPGIAGETCHYYDHLGGVNAKSIKSFVERGGVYLGICAGAYYATTRISYIDSKGQKKERVSPFGFLEGLSIGPVSRANSNELQTSARVRPMELCGKFSQFNFTGYALYSSGPTFDLNCDVSVLARFKDNENLAPSLIAKYYGKGLVMASSTVPYQNASSNFDELASSNLTPEATQSFNSLLSDLKTYESDRDKYWRLILETVKLHRQNLDLSNGAVLSNTP